VDQHAGSCSVELPERRSRQRIDGHGWENLPGESNWLTAAASRSLNEIAGRDVPRGTFQLLEGTECEAPWMWSAVAPNFDLLGAGGGLTSRQRRQLLPPQSESPWGVLSACPRSHKFHVEHRAGNGVPKRNSEARCSTWNIRSQCGTTFHTCFCTKLFPFRQFAIAIEIRTALISLQLRLLQNILWDA